MPLFILLKDMQRNGTRACEQSKITENIHLGKKLMNINHNSPCDPCEWRFPWEPVQGYLDSQQTEHSIYHYKRQDGNPLSTTLGLQAERLSPGTSSRFSRDSSSFIYHVVEGKGRTIIETPSNDEVVFLWDSKDTFAVPAWSRIQHINESAMGPAYLLAVNDAPFLDLLQLRRP